MSNAVDLHELLRGALDAPPERRAAFLAAACAGDAALRAHLERLLRLAERGDGFLDRSPITQPSAAPAPDADDATGRVVGAYRLLRPIGSGGMSEVWLAERVEGGFRQQVAIKRIHGPLGAAERFRAEREILAGLTHAGIARLYDGGVEPGGGAWMAMEYVEGEHLAAYCRTRGLPLAERLALFLQVCDAVAYAHTHLVVHRDLKPANILVTSDGQAKLLDFGIAKLLDEEARETTRTIQMTPAYAAPEQLSGAGIGTATDVHALGAILFELLTGRLPWTDDSASLATAVQRLLDAPLPLPSRVARADAPIARRALRGDLDAIVGKALRKEPDARYPDARALADDVRRHLAHEPVRARADARSYVLRRFLRRHWLALSTATAVFVAMAAAIVAVTQQAHKARLEAQRAAAVQAFMADLFRTNSSNQPDPVKARSTTARELLDIGVKRIGDRLDDAPENKLALLRLFGDLYRDFALSSEEIPLRRQAVELSRRLYGDDSPELVGDLLQQAWVTGDLDHDAAARAIDEARAILDRRHDETSFLRGRLLAAQASNDSSSDMVRARDEAARAVDILGRYPDSFELVDALYTQAVAEGSSGRYLQAMALLRRAIDLLVEVKGPHAPELAFYQMRLAQLANQAQRHAVAVASAQKAIDAAGAKGTGHDYDGVRAQATMVQALVGADRPRDALAFVARAKAAAPAVVENDAELRNYVHMTASRAEVRAGDAEAGLVDADAALADVRAMGRDDAFLALTLEVRAEALAELGRIDEAQQTLDDAEWIYRRVGSPPREWPAIQRIRLALDSGRDEDARRLFTALPPIRGEGLDATAYGIRRALLEAEIDLAGNHDEDAARSAAAAVAQARASELAPYLRSAIADGELIEGRARARGGDAENARALLTDALALRNDLYLPESPKIAEAEMALAECELARGRRAAATELVSKAEAIEKQHGALAARYRRPLKTLRARLGKG